MYPAIAPRIPSDINCTFLKVDNYISSPGFIASSGIYNQDFRGFVANSSTNVANTIEGFSILANVNSVNTFTGINVTPVIRNLVKKAVGVNIDMSNVKPFPGNVSSAVYQDLTYYSIKPTDKNITITYIGGGVAGSEVVTVLLYNITVQIENGISNAHQIKNAIDSNIFSHEIVYAYVTGNSSNPQVIEQPAHLLGGVAGGEVYALNITGDIRFNSHLITYQTILPTISGYNTNTVGIYTGSTDVAGIIFMNSGNGPYLTGPQLTVKFNVEYRIPPFVQITPYNLFAGVNTVQYYIFTTNQEFIISFVNPSGSNVGYIWSYLVVGGESTI